MNDNRRYVLISPCRDEAKFMRRTLESVARQSVPPALWVVVDDGSADGTSDVGYRHGVRVVRHPVNRGLAAARNSGLSASSAPK